RGGHVHVVERVVDPVPVVVVVADEAEPDPARQIRHSLTHGRRQAGPRNRERWRVGEVDLHAGDQLPGGCRRFGETHRHLDPVGATGDGFQHAVRASVVRHVVAVVTLLAGLDDPVTAARARALVRAGIVVDPVPVVTLLYAGLDDAVAAAGEQTRVRA